MVSRNSLGLSTKNVLIMFGFPRSVLPIAPFKISMKGMMNNVSVEIKKGGPNVGNTRPLWWLRILHIP